MEMKKLIFPVLVLAAMTSCTKEVIDNSAPQEIKLSASVSNVATSRAPIDGWNNTPVTFAKGTATGVYDASWNATVSTGGGVILTPSQVYHDTETFFLRGYAPQGTVTGTTVSFPAGMNGTQDILLSQELSGSKAVRFVEGTPFIFDHQLTQLNFKIVGSSEYLKNGAKNLTSIRVNGTALPVSMDIATGTITYNGAAASITAFAGVEPITTTVTAAAFGAVMVEPGKILTLTVEAGGNTYLDVPVIINGGGNAVKGTAYTITISIKSDDEIHLWAQITPWINDFGSADIYN